MQALARLGIPLTALECAPRGVESVLQAWVALHKTHMVITDSVSVCECERDAVSVSVPVQSRLCLCPCPCLCICVSPVPCLVLVCDTHPKKDTLTRTHTHTCTCTCTCMTHTCTRTSVISFDISWMICQNGIWVQVQNPFAAERSSGRRPLSGWPCPVHGVDADVSMRLCGSQGV